MAPIRAAVALLVVMAGLAVATPTSAQTFSDDVNVILRSNGILDIIGDNDDNRITLCQNPDDLEEFSVIIIAGQDFRVETVYGVTKDVRIFMRGGDDVVQLNGVTLPPADCQDVYPPPPPAPPPTDQPPAIGNGAAVEANDVCVSDEHGCHDEPSMLFPRDLRILLGSGSNSLSGYDFGVVDDLTVRGGSAYDSVSFNYINVWDRGDVNLLSGGSFMRVTNSYFGRSTFRSSTGNDTMQFFNTDLGLRPLIVSGSSNDRLNMSDIEAEGRWTINTGGGGDTLDLFGRRGACHEVCVTGDHAESTYQLNVIMGAQDDVTNTGIPLLEGDRLNGGSGNGDSLRIQNLANISATGGPTINGYEFIGPLFPDG